MKQQWNTKTFITKSNQVHQNKYTYTKTHYVNWATKVIVTCAMHGDFLSIPGKHMSTTRPTGCPKCANKNQTTEDFIRKSTLKHSTTYDYSNSTYINDTTKIQINCRIHGAFWMLPSNHHSLNQGCSRCTTNKHVTTESTIEKCKKTHGDLYDYSLTVYVNDKTPLSIICKQHGTFLQLPYVHWHNAAGCQQCARIKSRDNIGYYNQELFASNPLKKEMPTVLYYIKLTCHNEEFYKIGISNNPNRRIIPYKKYYVVQILKTIDTTLWNAWTTEQHILKSNIRYLPKNKFHGWTECFTTPLHTFDLLPF